MCDSKGTRFFRPWNAAEEKVIGEETKIPKYEKPEEDNDSVSSASCEEHSAGSLSENEATVTTSTGSPRRRRRRRRSESSVENSTRSCSVNSEVTEGNSLDMLSNFVFNSHPNCSLPIAQSSFPEDSFASMTDRGFYPTEYVQTFHRAAFVPNENSHCLPANVEANVLQNSQMAQFYYGLPVHQFPQGIYTSSVEEAVEFIHRQDAVAKQMKKLRPKKFRCEHCDVAFSNNGQLKGHIRIHTGERPFKCDAEGCGKSFTRNEELTRHKRIHTGLRPHSCILCGKRFGRKDHLKKHTRTHDSRDPYRMSATTLGIFSLGHTLPRHHPLPPYVYPI